MTRCSLYCWIHSTWRRCFFFFNDTATTEIYTLSLHDALPIFRRDVEASSRLLRLEAGAPGDGGQAGPAHEERESTRLKSSHRQKSYAGFCFKKKKAGADSRISRGAHARTTCVS